MLLFLACGIPKTSTTVCMCVPHLAIKDKFVSRAFQGFRNLEAAPR